ncbi:MAG: carboxypeptidase-like regulatory domain-containing protein [Thermonemataceae bacterium]|nr:carboxypeptidase-like regulatory domain-containing protein [Thermonemataceae bacterium]
MKKLFSLKSLLFFVFCSLSANNVFSQIEGYILDKKSQKPIEQAAIYMADKKIGVYSDEKGFFSFKANVIDKTDSITFFAIGYHKQVIAVRDLKMPLQILMTEDLIEEITVSTKNRKVKKKFLGDLRKTRDFIFGNTNYTQILSEYKGESNIFVSYIPNNEKKEGFIESVYIRLVKKKLKQIELNPITGEKTEVEYAYPTYIKLKVICVSANQKQEPDKLLSTKEMVFLIKDYKSQWLDISKFNIPFSENGAFVGVQILEVKMEVGQSRSGLGFPLLFAKNDNVNDYIFTSRGWLKANRKVPNWSTGLVPEDIFKSNSKKRTYAFAAKVSFYDN